MVRTGGIGEVNYMTPGWMRASTCNKIHYGWGWGICSRDLVPLGFVTFGKNVPVCDVSWNLRDVLILKET